MYDGMNDTQAMTTAKRDDLAQALTAAITARKVAEDAERDARADYAAACVQYGRCFGPDGGFQPGQTVKRDELRRGSYGIGLYASKTKDKTVSVRGVVTLAGTTGMNFRNHHPKPGEWFVLSASGQTAYSLSNGEWTAAD